MVDPVVVEPWEEHNRALVANVRPPDWTNPEPAPRYNLVVIGAGTAGLVTAIGAAGLGARVALVERELMGGDCLNVGCVPSKALLASGRAVAARPRGPSLRRRCAGAARASTSPPSWRGCGACGRGSARPTPRRRYRDLGVDVFFGSGRFTGPSSVDVDGRSLRFSKAVIATGARAAAPPIPGLAEAGYLTNETVFTLTALPTRLAVIGGGPIGCELAQAFARFGAEVTVLEVAPAILGREDSAAAALVARALGRDGVRLFLDCKIARVEAAGPERVLHYERAGDAGRLAVDQVLVAAGGAERGEPRPRDGRRGLRREDRSRGRRPPAHRPTPRIYAAGDICSRLQFTHNSDFQARIVIQNALFFGRARASALTIPRATYTDPEVAHVGLDEREAAERSIPIRTFVQEFSEVDRAVLDGEDEGFVKVHVRAGTDAIAGATVVARHAGDMLSELTLAMVHKVGPRQDRPHDPPVSDPGRGDQKARRRLQSHAPHPAGQEALRRLAPLHPLSGTATAYICPAYSALSTTASMRVKRSRASASRQARPSSSRLATRSPWPP